MKRVPIKMIFRKEKLEGKRGGSKIIKIVGLENAHMKDLGMEQKGYYLQKAVYRGRNVTRAVTRPRGAESKIRKVS